MASVNTDILGISELKWTGTGKFNSDDHHIHSQNGETLYSQQKQDNKLTVALIMNSNFKIRLQLKKVGKTTRPLSSVQYSSVTQLCPTMLPMNHIIPGLPVHQQLPEFTQTHVH